MTQWRCCTGSSIQPQPAAPRSTITATTGRPPRWYNEFCAWLSLYLREHWSGAAPRTRCWSCACTPAWRDIHCGGRARRSAQRLSNFCVKNLRYATITSRVCMRVCACMLAHDLACAHRSCTCPPPQRASQHNGGNQLVPTLYLSSSGGHTLCVAGTHAPAQTSRPLSLPQRLAHCALRRLLLLSLSAFVRSREPCAGACVAALFFLTPPPRFQEAPPHTKSLPYSNQISFSPPYPPSHTPGSSPSAAADLCTPFAPAVLPRAVAAAAAAACVSVWTVSICTCVPPIPPAAL